jgi:hypothetical protein
MTPNTKRPNGRPGGRDEQEVDPPFRHIMFHGILAMRSITLQNGLEGLNVIIHAAKPHQSPPEGPSRVVELFRNSSASSHSVLRFL